MKLIGLPTDSPNGVHRSPHLFLGITRPMFEYFIRRTFRGMAQIVSSDGGRSQSGAGCRFATMPSITRSPCRRIGHRQNPRSLARVHVKEAFTLPMHWQ